MAFLGRKKDEKQQIQLHFPALIYFLHALVTKHILEPKRLVDDSNRVTVPVVLGRVQERLGVGGAVVSLKVLLAGPVGHHGILLLLNIAPGNTADKCQMIEIRWQY